MKKIIALFAAGVLSACSASTENAEDEANNTVSAEAPAPVAEDNNQYEGQEAEPDLAQEDPFPYTAVMTCGMDGFDNINLMACLGGDVGTEIEVKNGDSYGLYKVYNLPSEWQQTERGVEFPLARNFAISMQNSNESLIMGLRVFDNSDNVMFQKQVGQYGVIKVSN